MALRTFRLLMLLSVSATLGGCVGMTAGAKMHSLTEPNGNVLQIAQYFCSVKTARYRNNAPVRSHQVGLKFLATDATGKALRQWTAYCDEAPANGTSACLVHQDVTAVPITTPLCAEYERFAFFDK